MSPICHWIWLIIIFVLFASLWHIIRGEASQQVLVREGIDIDVVEAILGHERGDGSGPRQGTDIIQMEAMPPEGKEDIIIVCTKWSTSATYY